MVSLPIHTQTHTDTQTHTHTHTHKVGKRRCPRVLLVMHHEYLVSFKISFLIKNNFICTLTAILQHVSPWKSIS